MTRQTSFQLDTDTEALIAFLKDRGFGNNTNILRTAVKRMAEEEGYRIMDTIAAVAMREKITTDYDAMRSEQAAGFPAQCGITSGGRFYIDTRITRDHRRSNNGGEYSYWTEYWHTGGKTYRLERASCDFWQPADEPEICDGEIEFLTTE